MSVSPEKHSSFIKQGGHTILTWIFWGKKRVVPETFVFEVRVHHGVRSRSKRMSVEVFERLHAVQQHTPVHVLTMEEWHWWWFQNVGYVTNELFNDPLVLKERVLTKDWRGERENGKQEGQSA
jgi:hypothetical protein